MVRGQFTKILMDKIKHDPDWDTASTSYDPLKFMALTKNTILSQTEDQYPFDTVYEQEVTFYSFHQQNRTNYQLYEKFNTKVYIGSAIGVTRQQKFPLEYVAQESNVKYDDMSTEEQGDVKEYSEERYLSNFLLRKSGKQHNKLKTDIQNNFTTGYDSTPNIHKKTLHLLDKYTNNPMLSQPTSEGVAIFQKGDRNKININTTTSSSGKTRSDATASRQGTQNPTYKAVPRRLLIRSRMTKIR